jgi:hypothetical protein
VARRAPTPAGSLGLTVTAPSYPSTVGRRYEDEREQRRLSRPWYRHEHKLARRESNRRVRHVARARLRSDDDDVLPKAPRTEGWMTW